MASIINTNIAAIRTHNVYNRNDAAMNAALTRVATGMKINSAKDGASTWAISEKMRERIRANDQANQNIQNDTALLKTAQGGVSNTIDILKTLKERAINAANDSNLNVDRGRIAVEVEQFLFQIDDNAEKVQFNGRKLLDGIGKDESTSLFVPTTPATDNTDETETVDPITEPTAVTATTDDGAGNSAVYKLAIGSAGDGSEKLVDDLGFTAGDTITFSWKADGSEFSKSFEVDENTTLADLHFDATDTDVAEGKLSLAFYANATALADQNGVATTGTTTTDAAGLWAVGDRQVAITNFAVSVTYKDTENENTETTRLDANDDPFQDTFKFTAVQQTTGVQATNTVMTVDLSNVYSYDPTGGSTAGATLSSPIYTLTDDASASALTLNANRAVKVSWSEDGGDTTISKYVGWDSTNSVATFTDPSADPTSTANPTITANPTLADLFSAAGLTLVTGDGNALVDGNSNEVLDKDGNTITTTSGTIYAVSADGKAISGLTFTFENSGSDTTALATDLSDVLNATATSVQSAGDVTTPEDPVTPDDGGDDTKASSAKLIFHIGGEEGFTMEANINSMKVDALFKKDDGTSYDAGSFASLFTDRKTAETALTAIDDALSLALNEQTKLGALESRLGYASDNITTMNENLEAADSVMRDSDIAKEMTAYMKYSVLAQASQYMLAQAGQNAFSVLNLLQQ